MAVEIKKTNELEKGAQIDIIGVVASLKEGTTSTKKPFLSLVIEDKVGQVDVKIWDTEISSLAQPIQVGDLVKARANVKEYQGVRQLDVELKDGKALIRLATKDRDGVEISDYVRTAPTPAQEMYDEILDICVNFKDDTLKYLTIKILEEHKEKLLYWPGAMTVHHAHHAGLLMHIHSMLKMAKPLIETYPDVDGELLQAGVILHDAGKLYEMDANSIGKVVDYTVEGTLLGHTLLGVMMIQESALTIPEGTSLNQEMVLCIQHMIASHHNEEAWGSAIRPAFLEAELLHHLDLMDSKMQQMADLTQNLEEGSRSERQKYLGNRRIYKKNA